MNDKPAKPRNKMVNVYNAHYRQDFVWGGGRIKPGHTGKIPNALYEKVKDKVAWVKRAERGDVI